MQPWNQKLWQIRQCAEKQTHYSSDKGPYSEGYGLPSGHVLLWELDLKEGRVLKNWCLRTMVLEKTSERSLDSKVKPVNLKGNWPWILVGRTDAEAETPILWPPNVKNWLIGKDPDAGKDWGQEEKGTVGWHHWLDGHESEQAPGVGDGQGGLVCCSPWGRRVGHDWATELNWDLHPSTSCFTRMAPRAGPRELVLEYLGKWLLDECKIGQWPRGAWRLRKRGKEAYSPPSHSPSNSGPTGGQPPKCQVAGPTPSEAKLQGADR